MFLKILKGILIRLAVLSAILLIFLLFKTQILRGLGNYLQKEDAGQAVDAAFVLSGNHPERISFAVQQYKDELTPILVTTGAYIDPDVEALGYDFTDAQTGMQYAQSLGVDTTDILMLSEGTSTQEESQAILTMAQLNKWEKIMIISSAFHTRRLHMVFKDKFEEAGIKTVILGAPPKNYELDRWWDSEEGLIFVNNEYIKLAYYAIKY